MTDRATNVAHSSQIALAAINLAVGLTVKILVPVSADNARTPRNARRAGYV